MKSIYFQIFVTPRECIKYLSIKKEVDNISINENYIDKIVI